MEEISKQILSMNEKEMCVLSSPEQLTIFFESKVASTSGK